MFREIFLCETGMHSGNLACLSLISLRGCVRGGWVVGVVRESCVPDGVDSGSIDRSIGASSQVVGVAEVRRFSVRALSIGRRRRFVSTGSRLFAIRST